MSIQHTREFLDKFLALDTPGIVAISGPWGVGKTFFWKDFYRKRKEEWNRHCEINDYFGTKKNWTDRKYAYVSLFGVHSVSQLENLVFYTPYVDYSPELSRLDRLRNFFLQLFWFGKPVIPYIKDADFASLGVERVFNRDYIVCLDDIERTSPSLRLEDILGYATSLRDDQNCKVLLILNEEKLDEGAAKYWNTAHEKAVDYSITFCPTTQEALENACIGGFTDGPRKVLERLQITNLRTLQRVSRNVNTISSLLANTSGISINSIQDVLSDVAMLTCLRYEDKYSNINIKSLRKSHSIIDEKNQRKGENEAKQLLHSIGYSYQGFHDEVIDFLYTYRIRRDELVRKVQIYSAFVEDRQIARDYRELWENHYSSNLQENDKELISAFKNFLDLRSSELTLSEIDEMHSLLRDLGEEDEDSFLEWCSNSVIRHASEYEQYELEEAQSTKLNSDAKLALERRYEELYGDWSIYQIICEIVKKSGWGTREIDFLDSKSVDDYKKWLANETSTELLSNLRKFLGSIKPAQNEIKVKSVFDKITSAITSRSQNKLNKIRIKALLADNMPRKTENGESDSD